MSIKKRRYLTLNHEEKIDIHNDYQGGHYYLKELCEKYNITPYTIKKVYEEIHQEIRYKEHGEVPKHPVKCNLCGGKVIFNKCNKEQSRSGFVYYCTECHAWVGTSPQNPTEALGELANTEVRRKRRELHQWFDKLWKNHEEREKYYDKLANALGKSECHFAQMSMEELEQAEKIIKKWWFEKFDR